MAQDVSVQLKIDGVFTEQVAAKGAAAGDVFSGEQITITRKYTPLQGLEPDRVEVTFQNDDDRYSLDNPTSDLYGKVGRNTQLRVRVGGTTRTTAEAASWRPDATVDHQTGVRGRAWCNVTGMGVLGRLGTWTDALHSPMFRTISNVAGLLGYYPMEDGKQAGTALTNTVPGGITGANIGGTYQGGDGPDGSEQLVASVDGCAMGGNFIASGSNDGWQFFFTFKLATLPPSSTYLPIIWVKSTVGYLYYIEVNDTTYRFTVVDSAGTTLEQTSVAWGSGGDPDAFIWFRLKVLETAGTISLEPAWYSQASGVLGVTLGFTGSHGQPSRWGHTGNAYTDGALYGHVGAVDDAGIDLLDDDFKNAFDGHAGERALDRFARLTFEEGITRYAISDGAAATMPMGVQRADTLLTLLQECADTDDALIYDEQTDIALTWFSRSSRFNQTPTLTLTYPGDISPPFRRVFDDAETANYVTAKNRDGGESTVEQTTGTMSTSLPPDGVGKVKKVIDVNIGDEDLLTQIADWWRTKGTIEGARFPTVVVDLLANPGLAADAALVSPGDLIRIDGYRAEPILLHAMGIEERVGSVTRQLIFTCLDASVWQTGVWQDVGESDYVWASLTTTLDDAYGAGGTRNSNTDFEDGISDWAGYGGAIAWTDFVSYGGAWVLKLTPDGVSSTSRTECGSVAGASAGQDWRADAWVQCAASRNVNANINWFDSGNNYLSTSNGAPVAVTAGVWATITVTGTAPASAARASLSIDMTGTPPVGHELFVDDAVVRPASVATMDFTFTDPDDAWSTTARYDVLAGGERIAVTAMGAVSGSGPYVQTATVIRAVNGVDKAQTAGTPVQVANPLRWTL